MRFIALRLPVEFAAIPTWSTCDLGTKALLRRPRLQQRAVHAEVLIARDGFVEQPDPVERDRRVIQTGSSTGQRNGRLQAICSSSSRSLRAVQGDGDTSPPHSPPRPATAPGHEGVLDGLHPQVPGNRAQPGQWTTPCDAGRPWSARSNTATTRSTTARSRMRGVSSISIHRSCPSRLVRRRQRAGEA